MNQSVGIDLLVRDNYNVAEFDYGCGPSSGPIPDTRVYGDDEACTCHTPIPVPTRLADPNRVRGARLYTGTLYLFFFFQIHIQKNYHRSGVHQNLYTYTESHLHIQKLYFQLHIQSVEPTVMNPY